MIVRDNGTELASNAILARQEDRHVEWLRDGSGVTIARNLLRKANGQPPLVEKAKKLPDDTIVRRLDPRSVDVMMIPELRAEDFGRLPWA
jgi:hypothetical protein